MLAGGVGRQAEGSLHRVRETVAVGIGIPESRGAAGRSVGAGGSAPVERVVIIAVHINDFERGSQSVWTGGPQAFIVIGEVVDQDVGGVFDNDTLTRIVEASRSPRGDCEAREVAVFGAEACRATGTGMFGGSSSTLSISRT